MVTPDDISLYDPSRWLEPGKGPRYLQLYRMISEAIRTGQLPEATQLPAERQLAEQAGVSRVTVRKAVRLLAEEGLLEQRHGAGSFVRAAAPRLQQSLFSLVSFSENLRERGQRAGSVVLERGLFTPNNEEILALGLSPASRVARIKRLRSADDVPMAIEASSLPEDILPHPERVATSLYDVLRAGGRAPTRAIQRVTAVNLASAEADHLRMKTGDAVLLIERTAYLAHGRPIEFTRGLYRSDIYDFVSELRLDNMA